MVGWSPWAVEILSQFNDVLEKKGDAPIPADRVFHSLGGNRSYFFFASASRRRWTFGL